MDINNSTDFGTVKILLLKGEKGDPGDAGDAGDYSGLTNKPSINGVTLDGNKTLSALGIPDIADVQSAQADALDAKADAQDALDATSVIGSGTLDTESQTIIPAINELKSDISSSSGNKAWTLQETISVSQLKVNVTKTINIARDSYKEIFVQGPADAKLLPNNIDTIGISGYEYFGPDYNHNWHADITITDSSITVAYRVNSKGNTVSLSAETLKIYTR